MAGSRRRVQMLWHTSSSDLQQMTTVMPEIDLNCLPLSWHCSLLSEGLCRGGSVASVLTVEAWRSSPATDDAYWNKQGQTLGAAPVPPNLIPQPCSRSVIKHLAFIHNHTCFPQHPLRCLLSSHLCLPCRILQVRVLGSLMMAFAPALQLHMPDGSKLAKRHHPIQLPYSLSSGDSLSSKWTRLRWCWRQDWGMQRRLPRQRH